MCTHKCKLMLSHLCNHEQLIDAPSAYYRYPHVFTLHCTAHALDLALERIGELAFFKDAIDKAKKVVQQITNSHAPHAVFKAMSELRLLKPGKCRAGNRILLMGVDLCFAMAPQAYC